MSIHASISSAARLFRARWKLFLGIHLSVSLLSFVILTPLYTTLLGWLVLTSGDVALTDEDIVMFILSPKGFVVFVIAMALLATGLVFEHAALFQAAIDRGPEDRSRLIRIGRKMVGHAWPLFQLGVRMVLHAGLVAAPFLAFAGWIFVRYLTEYDINYYLAERPPELWQTGGVIALSLLLMSWCLFRIFAGWVIAVPLLLTNQGDPASVLARSRQVAGAARGKIAATLALWALVTSVLFAGSSALLDFGVSSAIRLSGHSLQVLAYLLGTLLVAWSLLNMMIAFFSTAALSLGLLRLFQQFEPGTIDPAASTERVPASPIRHWRPTVAALAVMLVVVSGTAAWVMLRTADRQAQGHPVEIIAHRGASAEAPENTLAAISLAIEQGADWVEIDVQETREGEVVVIHDSDLMKVGRAPLMIHQASLAELQDVDIGSWYSPDFADQRVPTLASVLELARGKAGVIIELKYYGHEQQLEERVAAVVEAAGMQDRVKLMSLSLPGIRRMKILRPAWPAGLLSTVGLGDVSRLNVDFFAVNARSARRAFIDRAHQRGREVLVWTVNDPAQISAMIGREVDGIITDKPGQARQVRLERGELDLFELLIIQLASRIGSDLLTDQ